MIGGSDRTNRWVIYTHPSTPSSPSPSPTSSKSLSLRHTHRPTPTSSKSRPSVSSKFWLCVVKRSVKKGTIPPWWWVTTLGGGGGGIDYRIRFQHARTGGAMDGWMDGMWRARGMMVGPWMNEWSGWSGWMDGWMDRVDGWINLTTLPHTLMSGCLRKSPARAMCTIATEVSYTQPAGASVVIWLICACKRAGQRGGLIDRLPRGGACSMVV